MCLVSSRWANADYVDCLVKTDEKIVGSVKQNEQKPFCTFKIVVALTDALCPDVCRLDRSLGCGECLLELLVGIEASRGVSDVAGH